MKIQTVGKLLIAVGLVVFIYALNMPVSSGYSGIVNLHLMSERQNALIISGFVILSGVILYAVFKVRQTKEEERQDAKELNEVKQKFRENIQDGRQVAQNFYNRFIDANGERVNPFRDHPVARAITGLYVGVCASVVLGDLFSYGVFVGLPLLLWLSFRPRAASMIISRINMANGLILTCSVLVLYVQDQIDDFSYNANSIAGLMSLIPMSVVLWVYAKKRINN